MVELVGLQRQQLKLVAEQQLSIVDNELKAQDWRHLESQLEKNFVRQLIVKLYRLGYPLDWRHLVWQKKQERIDVVTMAVQFLKTVTTVYLLTVQGVMQHFEPYEFVVNRYSKYLYLFTINLLIF